MDAPTFNFHGRAVVLAAEDVPSSEMHVAIEHGLLTLAVRDAPLADVLRAIGEEAGFKVTIRSDLHMPVTKSFAGVRLDKAIRRLVGDITMVMIYAPSRDEAEPGRLTEIRLYKVPNTRVAPKQQTPPVTVDQSVLRDLAQQPDPAARAKSVRRLALERGEAAADVLAEVLSQDEDASVRMEAIDALAKMAVKPGATRSPAALATALADEAPSVRARAVHALSKVSGGGVVESVAETLRRDPDARVRLMAAWTLGKHRTESARSALEVAAEIDPEATVRREADLALQHWED